MKCEHCGRPIVQHQLPGLFGCAPKIITIECECQEERRKKEEEEQRRLFTEARRKSCGMPLEQQQCTLENFTPSSETKKHLQACKNYVDKFDMYCSQGKGILFTGNTGSGKTHLAAGIGNALIDRGLHVRYEPVVELLRKIQSTYRTYDVSENDVVGTLKSCQLLILDDLGAEKPSEWTMAQLHSLIDYRYSNFKPTIITTNLSTGELTKVLGVRTVDRILDTNKQRYVVLNLAVPSYRRQK